MTREELLAKIEAIRKRATEAQHRAADPGRSVWVSANAGTGKTRVLTNRILRLLVEGAQVADILAVTYTRMAAQEMRNRVFETLSEWAVSNGSDLENSMRGTGLDKPTEKQKQRARQLFATLLDQPVSLRIETIHAFSQSVLRRFPVEAGIQPNFELATEAQITQLQQETATQLLASTDPLVKAAITSIVQYFNADQFFDHIKDFGKYPKLLHQLRDNPGAVRKALFGALECPDAADDPDAASRQLIASAAVMTAEQQSGVRQAVAAIREHGTAAEQKKADKINAWLEQTTPPGITALDHYAEVFLTADGKIRATLLTKAVAESLPEGLKIMTREAERLISIYQKLHAITSASRSFHLMVLAEAMAHGYADAKKNAGLMDYDDLISTTHDLLAAHGGAAWVRYKLDRGINHLLIDEAQDTSPEQWQILNTLADEFFTGDEEHEADKPPRSLFSVGDYKQSIYSFQGARPDLFTAQENHFRRLAENAHKPFSRVDLDTSFRSVVPVLGVVDQVTQSQLDNGQPALPGLRETSAGDVASHVVLRLGQAGFIDMMDVVVDTELEEDEHGKRPDVKQVLARQIVATIRSWIGTRMLPSRGRVMNAGDILILLRDRQKGGLYHVLDRELRLAGLPVAGADRIRLNEDIAVHDLLALGRAVLLPEDDLSLAAVLKSPLFGLDDSHLFRLAHGRRKSSLQARLATLAGEDQVIAAAHDRFTAWLDLAERRTPHGFFSSVLDSRIRQDFARRLGNHVGDVLAEFLDLARQYERVNPPSLLGFIEDVEKTKAEISRESESRGRDEIRIMTIHGAKGLEAPVVILPDTLRKKPKPPRVTPLLDDDLPVLQVTAKCPHPVLAAAAGEARQKSNAEDDRLFYVAMTRAQDGLMVAGFESSGRRDRENSWYEAIEKALVKIGKHGTALAQQPVAEDRQLTRYEVGQQIDPKIEERQADAEDTVSQPSWLHQPAPIEKIPPRPLTPSRYAPDEVARSPVGNDRQKAMERGVLTHRMLELLPQLADDARQKAAARIIDAGINHLTRSEAEAALAEVLALLVLPELAAVFGPDARAEVPVSGLVAKTPVSGVIDRLVVEESRITIVDFKTGAAPDLSQADGSLPRAYISQMALYRHLVGQIWPGRDVEAGLLYTENARMYWVDPAAMDIAIAEMTEQS